MAKYVFIYDPDKGVALTDGQVRGYAEMIISSALLVDKAEFIIANENVIKLIRIAVRKGKFNYEDVEFKFKDETIRVDKQGFCFNYPDGFIDLGEKICWELLSTEEKF